MTHPQSEHWSDYIDGELPLAEARELETHLEVCGECRRLLNELRGVVARAGALEDRPPRADLWPRVSAQIGVSRRRFVFSMPELLAAGIALMLISGGGVAFLLRDEIGAPVAWIRPEPEPVVRTVATGGGYDAAIGQLQRELVLRTDVGAGSLYREFGALDRY